MLDISVGRLRADIPGGTPYTSLANLGRWIRVNRCIPKVASHMFFVIERLSRVVDRLGLHIFYNRWRRNVFSSLISSIQFDTSLGYVSYEGPVKNEGK